jgi:hypothetical protein
MSSNTITKMSQCNCGRVRVKVTGIDRTAVHVSTLISLEVGVRTERRIKCYCLNCQRTTGTAFAHNRRFKDAELEVESGQDVLKTYADNDTKSGNTLFRNFCSNCVSVLKILTRGIQTDPEQGSQMFLTNSGDEGFVALHEGSMLEEKTPPTNEIFLDQKYPVSGARLRSFNSSL